MMVGIYPSEMIMVALLIKQEGPYPRIFIVGLSNIMIQFCKFDCSPLFGAYVISILTLKVTNIWSSVSVNYAYGIYTGQIFIQTVEPF